MKKLLLRIFLLFLLVTVIIGLNNQLTLTEYSIANPRIPDSFDGYRIAVVSDLHAERFGSNQQDLIAMLRETQCDLICFPGDIASDDTTDFSPIWELIDCMSGTPMVYVTGNNELSLKNFDTLLSELRSHGVTVLDEFDQTTLEVSREDDSILIHGYSFRDGRKLRDRLSVSEKGFFNILLYHDPYVFPEAASLDYDLMLSGHMHGGIIRFPLLGSPLEWFGIEPYTKGVYTNRAATLILSGGLGARETLPRFFNDPEVLLITLHASGKS